MLVFVFCNPAMAAETTGAENTSSFELGVTYRHFDYKEDINPPQKSTESGWLPGVYFNYAFQKKSVFYTKVHLDYAAADIDFDGTTNSGRPITFSDQKTKLFKFEWDVGYPIPLGNDFTLIPYLGYGFRYWSRGDSRFIPQVNAYSIKEEYYSHYIPVGIQADYNVTDRLSIGATAAAHFMFTGKAKSYASEVLAGVADLDFTLGNKVGFYAEIPVTFRFTKNWAVVLTPWYEYSAFGQSDTVNITYGGTVVGYAYEPASKTNQYGVNLGANLSF
jgi:hypothetical protein